RPINWNGTIRLSIYNKQPRVKAGQRWQFVVRLKRGSGFANSAGFDYEKWLFAQRIEAKGYLRKSDQHKLLAKAPWYSINALRETIHHKITTTLDAVSNQALVSALILAEKSAVSKAQWAVFRATGTSHLMAISGLHIGLVASSGLALVWLLWWCFPRLNLYLPHRLAGSFVGVIFAIFYAMLAGMTIPTQRALTMVVIGLLLLANRQNISGYRILALAMIVVLLMDPLATLTVGFYLSFAAVLVILWLVKRVVKAGRFSLLSLQGFLSLLMIPLSLLFFGEGSLVSPLANLLAIPWVSFIIVPLSMLSVLLSFISDSLSIYLFQFLSIHLNALYALLAFLAKAPSATVESFHLPHYLLAASLVAGVILLMPVGLAWRYTAGFILLPLIFYEVATLEKHNEFRLTVLDVGQGLAVVVETKHHSLLFDTGNRSGDSFDLGDMVVVPYLKQRSIKRLDALVISHDDQDHMGGLESVLKHTTVTAFYGNRLGLLQSRANTLCKAGDAWQWDGVDFEFIHPTVDWQGSDNDRSCVLKIRAGKHAVLLTGDIQRKAEKYLVKQSQHSGDLLAADILLMPHHGSNTSSKQYFIRAVNPRWAIASAGYRSRFRHPDHRVLKRYQQHGVTVLNTAQSGAIQFHIRADQAISPPKEYRLINQRFWSRSTPLP
ncbi:MAG: DNA internalization-related competence protein ComEC/Rec2, partial [Leucothrix sp.]